MVLRRDSLIIAVAAEAAEIAGAANDDVCVKRVTSTV